MAPAAIPAGDLLLAIIARVPATGQKPAWSLLYGLRSET